VSGFVKPKLPITLGQQRWVDGSFLRLAAPLGTQRLQATVVLSTPDHFPDLYDSSALTFNALSSALRLVWR